MLSPTQSCQSGSGLSGRVRAGLGLIGSGSGRAWILKNCLTSIEPDTGAKSRFSVSGRFFAIANGILH